MASKTTVVDLGMWFGWSCTKDVIQTLTLPQCILSFNNEQLGLIGIDMWLPIVYIYWVIEVGRPSFKESQGTSLLLETITRMPPEAPNLTWRFLCVQRTNTRKPYMTRFLIEKNNDPRKLGWSLAEEEVIEAWSWRQAPKSSYFKYSRACLKQGTPPKSNTRDIHHAINEHIHGTKIVKVYLLLSKHPSCVRELNLFTTYIWFGFDLPTNLSWATPNTQTLKS